MPDTMTDAKLTSVLGLFSLSLLALTGCLGLGEEEAEGTADQDTSDQDTSDQGTDADQEASENPDAAEEDTEEDSEASGQQAPGWSDVSEEMWSSMEAAESVDLTLTMPYSGERYVDEEFQDDLEIDAGDDITQRIYGALEGPAVFEEQAGAAETTYLLQDDLILVSGEDELEAAADLLRAEGIDPAQFEEELADQYIDYSEIVLADISIEMFISDVRALTRSAASGSMEAAEEERDGEEVWVYTDGTTELVVEADDEPRLLDFTLDLPDGTAEGSFSDWDSAEVPEEADTADILSQDELLELFTR
ncbi:hypothetical protein [Nesterenkonia aerolata]|uniref:Uncharacterized protein n=1 Tax=Nesterenkonia aerolata TaxID=3074079 RepID=A0ABU2DQK1_9MICC|nr:hypothetical protein [Nesterenkonia sp. LY-0111]MDR8018783.1 hypothetical protein [Nesterenkonia sp. LY-0111]